MLIKVSWGSNDEGGKESTDTDLKPNTSPECDELAPDGYKENPEIS
jgi:hypothetical protein